MAVGELEDVMDSAVGGGESEQQSATTDRIAIYPSAALRPVPGFKFAIPDGWVLDESPNALCVVRTPQAVEDFWVNAIVSTDRVHHQLDLPKAAAITLDRLKKECPDVEVRGERTGTFGQQRTYIRSVELSAPNSGRRLAQVHGLVLTALAAGAKTKDLFQITGTCQLEAAPAFGRTFVELIGSFRLV